MKSAVKPKSTSRSKIRKRAFWSSKKIAKNVHTRLDDTSQMVVGSKIDTFWDGERKFYPCVVTKIYNKRQMCVKYDDGEIADEDLKKSICRFCN